MEANEAMLQQVGPEELIAFFQDLHRHPELSLQEHRTTQQVLRVLEAHGIETLETGLDTGTIAVIRGHQPGRVIGLRCDMDALPIVEESGLSYASETPGVMHACGHDFHTAAMLGAALLLKQQEEQLHGTVKIIFQPAEESSDGGAAVVQTGLLQDVEEFYGIHTYPGFPAGTLGIKPGAVMAAPDRFAITLRGVGAHAGQPYKGIDPIPALAALIQSLQSLLTRRVDPFAPAILSITHVEAGNTWNVVPETAFLEGTVRTLDPEVRSFISAHMRQMAEQTASAYDCQADFVWQQGPDAVLNDAALCSEAADLARTMGFQVAQQEDTMGGEDFSEYLKLAPGVFIRVGTGGGIPNHHPKFTADASALWPAAEYFAKLAQVRTAVTR